MADLQQLIDATWDELGYKIRARGYWLWVRTMPHARKVGSLWLPTKLQGFYGELPHLQSTKAVVLSAGSAGVAKDIKPGDVVVFKRLHFALYKPVGNPVLQEKVGWIDANQILYCSEDEDHGVSYRNDALMASEG